jgi:hypothetical protein
LLNFSIANLGQLALPLLPKDVFSFDADAARLALDFPLGLVPCSPFLIFLYGL